MTVSGYIKTIINSESRHLIGNHHTDQRPFSYCWYSLWMFSRRLTWYLQQEERKRRILETNTLLFFTHGRSEGRRWQIETQWQLIKNNLIFKLQNNERKPLFTYYQISNSSSQSNTLLGCTRIWASFSDTLLLTIVVNGRLSPNISFHQECKKWHMSKLQVSPPVHTSIQMVSPEINISDIFHNPSSIKIEKQRNAARTLVLKGKSN